MQIASNELLRRRATLRSLGGVAMAWLTGSLSPATAGATGEVEVGKPLREATMRGLNGPSRKLSEFRGRPLLINVWASWCGPCRDETASLERLSWSEVAANFAIIGISTDDDPGRAMAWLGRSNATVSHFIDSGLVMEKMLGASRLPLTVLVGADGLVLTKVYGAREWDGATSLELIRNAFGIHKRPGTR